MKMKNEKLRMKNVKFVHHRDSVNYESLCETLCPLSLCDEIITAYKYTVIRSINYRSTH